jgi:hypothetical protein
MPTGVNGFGDSDSDYAAFTPRKAPFRSVVRTSEAGSSLGFVSVGRSRPFYDGRDNGTFPAGSPDYPARSLIGRRSTEAVGHLRLLRLLAAIQVAFPGHTVGPGLTRPFLGRKVPTVNAREIIREIESLPRDEQVEVIRFVYRLDAERKLSGGELTSLAERLADTAEPAAALILRDAIVRGFYGAKPNA